MSLGFEQAGFDIAAAVEIDPIHAAVHHFNFPCTSMLVRSVVGLTGQEIRKAAMIGRRTIDVVFGGPPCQGFSLIGQRMLEDPRNHLVKEFVRIVAELRPRTFVFENVKGLTLGGHRQFLDELIEAFSLAGYRVRLPWQVLNAMHYGVPQDRERLFLMGVRKRQALPSYPPRTTEPERTLLSEGLTSPTPTCQDALSDLPDADKFEKLLTTDSVAVESWEATTSYARQCRPIRKGGWYFGIPRRWNEHLLTSSMRTIHTAISRRRFETTKWGKVEPISRFLKLDPIGMSNTLRAGTDTARGAFTSPRPIHFRYSRCITVREMARLHGFPDWFRFHVTKWHGARQVGNSVPPPLARAIAQQVMASSGLIPKLPDDVLDLGDADLLSMDMGQAAKYWRVEVPIARRDRKSGFKKRKQVEIEAGNRW
jgi:DNA (cytosine-5)-methyltransferase 1